MAVISLESLRSLFSRNGYSKTMAVQCNCFTCGDRITIEIVRTTGGFGLQGGVLFEAKPANLHAECDACYLHVSKSGRNQLASGVERKRAG